jgi:hypothetical protein
MKTANSLFDSTRCERGPHVLLAIKGGIHLFTIPVLADTVKVSRDTLVEVTAILVLVSCLLPVVMCNVLLENMRPLDLVEEHSFDERFLNT